MDNIVHLENTLHLLNLQIQELHKCNEMLQKKIEQQDCRIERLKWLLSNKDEWIEKE